MSESATIYQVSDQFEMAVVRYLSTSTTFALHFLPHIKAELFSSQVAEEIVGLLLKYFKKTSKAPGSYAMTEHLVTQWYNKGKITKSVKRACVEYLFEAELSVTMPEDDCHQQFAELVREWKHHNALDKAMDMAFKRQPLTEIAEEILGADAVLSKKDSVHAYGSSDDATKWINIIKKSGHVDRLPTGIPEFDHYMKGGLMRKALGVIAGSTGAGKSTLLRQLCASALLRGIDCAYISLEDDDATVSAGIFAPIAGIPLSLVIQRPDAIEPYVIKTCRRLKTVPGSLYIEEFSPGITVTECLATVRKNLEKEKAQPRAWFFDYATRFGGGKKRHDNLYMIGGDAAQSLRNFVREQDGWGWTAAQLKRLDSRGSSKETDENSVAGSMEIPRIADALINLQFNKSGPTGPEIRASFAKNRGAAANVTTNWSPVDYKYGTVFDSPDFRLIPLEKLAQDRMFGGLIELE